MNDAWDGFFCRDDLAEIDARETAEQRQAIEAEFLADLQVRWAQ